MGCVQTNLNNLNSHEAIATTVTAQHSITNIVDKDENKSAGDGINTRSNNLQNFVQESESGNDELARKTNVWKNLDFFILDNSLRETTVAQIQHHTLEDKKKIFKEVEKCGFTDIIVAAFNSATRVDDQFVQWLQETQQKNFDKFYSFSEISVGIEYDANGNSLYRYNTGDSIDDLPDGMKKNKQYGLRHTVFEADFANTDDVKWGETWTVDDMCKLIEKRIRWVKDNMYSEGRNFLNMRDIARVMRNSPLRMFKIIKYMAEMPKEYRLYGMIFEEPIGDCMPEQIRSWCKAVRHAMNSYGWKDGLLLCHIHAKMGYKDVITMDCLANGCDGIWAAVCEEGAAVGHCSSAVTTLNLIRHGNTKVIDKYNCTYLRQAAIQVTKLTTKSPPHPKQIVYGERATDLVFGAGSMGSMGKGIVFDLAKFFNMETEERITTLASPDMIVGRLKRLFGDDNEQFTEKMAIRMKAEMIRDLSLGIKSEYHSPYGIALLFERVGGRPTQEMLSKLDEHKTHFEIHNKIRNEIHHEWNRYTIKNVNKNRGTGSTAVLASIKKKTRRNLLRLQTSRPLVVGGDKQPEDKKQEKERENEEEEEAGLLMGKSISINSQDIEHESEIKQNEDKHVQADENDFLTFDKFYHGFMQPYFGCYRCQITKNALKILDVDDSGTIEWNEFCSFVDLTLNQYNDEIISSSSNATNIKEMAQLCLKLTFEKGIIPAMRDRVNENLNPFTRSNFHVIQPINYVSHTATMIFLHGIADIGEGAGTGTFWYNEFSLSNIQKEFPYVRYVFPTADKRPITDLDDSHYPAWFDVNHQTNKTSKKIPGGLYNSVEKIQTLIKQEMSGYNIKANRIMICGFNQGATVALLAALGMYKDFAALVCVDPLLFGNDKKEVDENFSASIDKNRIRDARNDDKLKYPIHWTDIPTRKFYKDFGSGDEFCQECGEYLKQDCKLNIIYQTFKNGTQKHKYHDENEPSVFQVTIAKLIRQYLPKL